jgi:dTDP-4-dehydrorhamnose reductase
MASTPISKYDLLCLVRDALDLNIEIGPDDEFVCDRSLNGSAFIARTGISIPSWREMIEALRDDPTPYEEWRRQA